MEPAFVVQAASSGIVDQEFKKLMSSMYSQVESYVSSSYNTRLGQAQG